jgi:threonine dehydrogenase-like Zn-dependent dehydrogenase
MDLNHKTVTCLVLHAEEAPNDEKKTTKYKNPKLGKEERVLQPLDLNSLRVEIIYAGICGTDIHVVKKNHDGFISTSAPVNIPENGRIIGHEGVGRILEVGSNVTNFQPGDIIALESLITCKGCEPCQRGYFNQCLNAQLIGMQFNGIFANIADLPSSVAYNVNEICVSEDGLKASACLEPAGVAWLACHDANLDYRDHIIIFGGGPIGFFCAMIARVCFNVSHITLVEPENVRRKHASKWCDNVFDLGDKAIYQKQYDVVIEASGFTDNIQDIMHQIKAKGRIILLARSGKPFSLENIDHIITNAIKIIGVRGHVGGVFKRLIDMYQSGNLPLHEAVTGVIHSMDELVFYLNNSDNLISNHCKVLAKLNP